MSDFTMEQRGFMALEFYKHNDYEVVKNNFRSTFPGSPVPCDKTILKYYRKILFFGCAEDKKYSREAPVLDNTENNSKIVDKIRADPNISVRKLALETGLKKVPV